MAGRVKWDDSKAKAVAKAAGIRAATTMAEKIIQESQNEAPHASGTMQRSSTVSPKGATIYMSYNTPYAVKQHEDLTLRHPDPTNPISSTGRKAKYLEDPFNRLKAKAKKFIQLSIKEALRKGGG